eukprot:1152016_1
MFLFFVCAVVISLILLDLANCYRYFYRLNVKEKILFNISNQSVVYLLHFAILRAIQSSKDKEAIKQIYLSHVDHYADLGVSRARLIDKTLVNHSMNSIVNAYYAQKSKLKVYSMLDVTDLNQLERCCTHVLENGIEGNFLEAGVWKGGCCIFMKSLLNKYKSDRKLYLMDSFASMNDFENHDDDDNNGDVYKIIGTNIDAITIQILNEISKYYETTYGEDYHLINVTASEVINNFKKLGVWDAKTIKLIEGWISEKSMMDFITNIMNKNEKLSIIRIDLDLYEPTKLCLKYLYDKLSIGGWIIFDEYFCDWLGEKYAVDEFRKQCNINEPIIQCGLEPNPRIGYWQKQYDIFKQ